MLLDVDGQHAIFTCRGHTAKVRVGGHSEGSLLELREGTAFTPVPRLVLLIGSTYRQVEETRASNFGAEVVRYACQL